GTQFGDVYALTLDDNFQVVGTQIINTISGLSNPNILGIAFNPFDPPVPPRIYVSHGQLFANGGSCFTGTSPYSGQVSILEGPNFDSVIPLIQNLPVSNHDHSVNGLTFDNNGDLYISEGGNTNAGVKHCNIGDLPESPLSGAVLKAEISKPSFNGTVIYLETATSQQNMDQVDGGLVDVAPGVDVSVYGAGLRNSYDLIYTTRDMIFAADNGPNGGFGAASTGPDTEGPHPTAPDEFLLVEFGRYYGHPNRNRGRYEARQNIYHGPSEPSVPGDLTAPLLILLPAMGGIMEYRANNFNGAMRGDLIAQQWNGDSHRITLSADGRTVAQSQTLPISMSSLDVISGPGGVIFGGDHGNNKIAMLNPSETQFVARLFDIFPWRAPAVGGHPFVLSGVNFGNLGNTTVTIGGNVATLSSVTSTRIRGIVPAEPSPSGELVDIQVTTGGESATLQAAFRYLLPAGNDPFGWRDGPPLDHAIGEVAAGVIGEILYVVGESHPSTQFYDIASGTWGNPTALSERPFQGNHHAAAVFGGKFYLFGGLGNGSDGQVQIYDPVTNTWSLGAVMPWSTGSASAALIGGEVYVCGGIINNQTVDTCGAYDPVADSWTLVTSMPLGRNHAAAASDGSKMYIFGGRGLGSGNGNTVANGFDDVQIYDPVTDTWDWSGNPSSLLAPLPQKRGGTGAAVHFQGEFYVMGGETANGGGATANNVYDRVDIYDPVNNTWRIGPSMPTARHGIFPVLNGQQIYVPGGGESAGGAQSTVFEIYAP
ncbi:MAG: IPT/TIG domain-containing protein, partial [Gammaproteobacteria bacterium]|nr:IPT/TIG domain-containing protein [Gammaproteobacteria bacterium]